MCRPEQLPGVAISGAWGPAISPRGDMPKYRVLLFARRFSIRHPPKISRREMARAPILGRRRPVGNLPPGSPGNTLHANHKWRTRMKRKLALLTLVAALSGAPILAKAADIDWNKIDAALGKSATVAGDVHRYGLPRSDLQVSLDSVTIKPTLALGGWIAFAPMHGEAMVMGDLVLLETEITPVMTKLLDGGGLDITAIHNHKI